MCLAHGQKLVTPVRLEPATLLSRVKHSTTDHCAPLGDWGRLRYTAWLNVQQRRNFTMQGTELSLIRVHFSK